MDLPRSFAAVRLLIAIALFVVFLCTCYNSIMRLREGAIAKTTSSSKTPAIWPAITLCNDKYVENETIAKMSFNEIMDKVPRRRDLIKKSYYVTKVLTVTNESIPEDRWTKHVYFIDAFQDPTLNIWTCYTLQIDGWAMPMDQVVYYLATNSSGPWFELERYSMIIHEKDQFVFNDFDTGRAKSFRTFKDPRSLTLGHMFQVGMSINTNLNIVTNPCDEKNQQLITPCVETFVVKEIGCRMPWMRPSTYPDCNKTTDIFKIAHINKMIRSRVFGQIVSFTGCRPNCQFYSYSASYVSSFDDREHAISFMMVQEDTPNIVEGYVYQFGDFLADLGGYLGLLVGASALSLVEYVLLSLHFVGKRLRGSKKKGRKRIK